MQTDVDRLIDNIECLAKAAIGYRPRRRPAVIAVSTKSGNVHDLTNVYGLGSRRADESSCPSLTARRALGTGIKRTVDRVLALTSSTARNLDVHRPSDLLAGIHECCQERKQGKRR